MAAYTAIIIIYNPNSTGSGKTLAEELKQQLDEISVQNVKIIATEYAGHAEKLAYTLAKASSRPLVISASGDGGYNEVVNGILRAKNQGAKAVAGLLPAGNANDHYHHLHDGDLITAILNGKTKKIDLLHLSATVDGKPYERYAHSYIGMGLTPKVGQELNKTQLNRLKEMYIVAKSLVALQPVRLKVNGKKRTYDSLIFSNINKMSKVLTIAKDAKHNDGQFEITTFYRRNKLKLLLALLHASTFGYKGDTKATSFAFESLKPILVQLDGEIATLDALTEAQVSVQPKALECVV
ncbi:MAG: diacylglycerol kinase catalytic region [Candidatus Saccharibacteria bacterium]|nr:diacylglycerol kinase catalytic region [Candidatus Saccharibacteria bacterium]